MNKSSLLIAMLLFSASCSKVKELDKRTENMEKSTSQMSKTTDDMRATMAVMYEQLRSGDSLRARNEAYKLMQDKDSQIRTKITGASMYMMSFEFQLWTDNQLYDDDFAKHGLFSNAADEFTRRAGDLYDLIKPEKLSPINAGVKYNNDMCFYALAITLHMNHHFQDEIVRKNSKLQTNSLYDIIKGALLKEKNHQPMEDYEELIVSGMNKEVMIELIKARVDIMAALGLKNLTDKREMTLSEKSKALLFKITDGKLGSLELPGTYAYANDPTKNKTQEYLDGALKAKKFLKLIGVNKTLEKNLVSAFNSLSFDDNSNTLPDRESKGTDTKKENLKSSIKQLME